MQKSLFLCLVLMSFNIISGAQIKTKQEKLDSLLKVYQNHPKEDSIKLVIGKQLYKQYMALRNFGKTEEYVAKTVVLARKIRKEKYAADAFYSIGLFYHGFANYQKAEENYSKAIESYSSSNNFDMVAGTYLNLGALYIDIPDYIEALEVNQKAIDIYLKMNNREDLASCYVNVAQIFRSLNQQYQAINYTRKAENIFATFSQYNRGLASTYSIMGASYLNASDDDLQKLGLSKDQQVKIALNILKKGLIIAEKIDDATTKGPIYQNLAVIYELAGNRKLAIESYENAIKYNNEEDNKTSYASSLIAFGNFYSNEGVYAKADGLLLEALSIGKRDKLLEIQRNSYQKLSENEERRGNFNQSLNYYRSFISFKDQIFNQEKEREINRKQMQLDFTLKENDYQLKQKLTEGELQRQVLFAKQQQQQLILKKQQLQLSDKERLLQRLAFLQTKANLENKQQYQINLLKQQELTALIDKKEKVRQIKLQTSELNFNKKVNIFLGVLALILFGTAVFIFFAQRKTAKLNKIVSEQKQELEKLGKVKDRIFSVVSHDMRTPINSLISLIQLLEAGNIDQSKLIKYASLLKNTLGHTSAMMENLLNWAMSQLQGFKPLKEKFDLQLCVQDIINSMQANSNQKKIQLENIVSSGILCNSDMNMTSLIIRNLVSNAIKFTPNNGSIKILAKNTNDDISISIIDNGVGMSKIQLLAFNESIHQENGINTFGTNQEKGTGIGLLLCKTFTTLMAGTLRAESEPNKGSKFTLTLPAG